MIKCLVLTIWFLLHPVHVSLTSIEYAQETDSLNVFVKIYFDDFLLDLKMDENSNSQEKFPADSLEAKEILAGYLNSKLVIEVNEKKLQGKLKSLKIVDNEVKLNLQYRLEGKPENIFVRNLIMTELYKDQVNLMIVKVKEFEEVIRLTSDVVHKRLNLKDLK